MGQGRLQFTINKAEKQEDGRKGIEGLKRPDWLTYSPDKPRILHIGEDKVTVTCSFRAWAALITCLCITMLARLDAEMQHVLNSQNTPADHAMDIHV